ncbi:MAG: hydroxyacid dehydrogenase, partial [Clostridia bacterium]|nr:hydroxyacid dehydrogenase [Clostridia bacterium]
MKVLLLGDRFMTNEVLEAAIRRVFDGCGVKMEFTYLSDNWPVDPVEKNDEVCEYCGDETAILPLIRDADILMTHTGCITSRVIAAAQKLRVIGVGRGGPVNINMAA